MKTFEQVEMAIRQLIAETNPDVFVVEIRLHRSKRSVLSILADTDRGISIEECAEISRRTGALLETEEFFNFPFQLEVSSPGLDQPLKIHRQYLKNIGRDLRVVTQTGETFTGTLSEVTQTGISLAPELPKGKKAKTEPLPDMYSIDFKDIKSAKVQISFK